MLKSKLVLSGLLCSILVSSVIAEDEIKNCSESGRAIRSVSMMGMGAAAGGVGAPVGLALGSIAHDYECGLNWFAKDEVVKPKLEEKQIEVKQEIVEPKKEIVKKEVTIDHFATFNKNSSKPTFVEKKLLSNDKIESITLVGHTSTDGTIKYNQKLSEQRAKAIKKSISKLVDPKKIKTIGKGKSINKYSKFYENQRVEAIIKYK